MDFEMKLNSEQQRTLLLSYTYVKIWHDIIPNSQPPGMHCGMSEPLIWDKWH
jgi:hypothetical protein